MINPYWKAVALEAKCRQLRQELYQTDRDMEDLPAWFGWIYRHTFRRWFFRHLEDSEKTVQETFRLCEALRDH